MRLTVPGPGLGPDEVVLAQLAGLQACTPDGDDWSDGMERVWAFASPDNKAATGPVERFASMLRAPAYRGLLGHRAAQLGPVAVEGDTARLEVLLLTADDRTEGYTWVLGLQTEPPYAGCWMTDGVLRHRPTGPGQS